MKRLKRLLSVKIARRMNQATSVPVPSIISEGTKVKGDIFSDGTIHVDGKVEGDVNCGQLIIGVRGSVSGSVSAGDLHLYGSLSGKAMVDSLFVAKTAKLTGDATHNSIAIEPGAYIDGHCIRSGSVEQNKSDLTLISANGTTGTSRKKA